MLSQEQNDYLLMYAYNAAIRAGARIIDIYTGGADYAVDMKSDHTPITIADRDAHELIKTYLGKTRIPLLSEEGRDLLYEERRNWDLFWMVDPLDGTKEFIKGNGEFTVNIALMYNNEPVIGVIYVPYIHKLYFALKGAGSFLKREIAPDHEAHCTIDQIREGAQRLPLQAASNAPIRIAVSRSHDTPETFEHIEQVKLSHPDAQVVEQGSSYKFSLLAEAAVEVYFRTSNTYEWDTAAGEVILSEAGGVVE
ncbi:MAG: 3'(2'),5'-bisphosphate nucleotidase CysQ, partial [Alistipes sp.]|nr:3'(2'),5'-bisphosphate nucleotidase CysQ [Alistipes sp.]